MKRIFPIEAEQCKEHFGKPVLVILKDGSEVFGILSKVENGKLVLGSEEVVAAERADTSKSRKKAASVKGAGKKRTANLSASPVQKTVQTSAFPGAYPVYPYGAGPILLDLALIALLFVLI